MGVKIVNIKNAIEEAIIPSTTKKLLAHESLKADLLEQIATAKNKSIKPLEISEVMAFLKGFAELDYSKEENRTRLLEMFVHKIYLFDDCALIAYKGTNNPAVELKLEHKKTERELLFEFGIIGAPTKTRTWDNSSEAGPTFSQAGSFYTVFYHKISFCKTAVTRINKGFQALRLNKKHYTTFHK